MPSLPFLIQNKIKYNLSFTYSLALGDQSIMRVRLKEQKALHQCVLTAFANAIVIERVLQKYKTFYMSISRACIGHHTLKGSKDILR